MQVELAVLADAANISDAGKLNLLGVFQTVLSEIAPCHLPSMVLVMMVRADSGDKGKDFRVSVKLQDGDSRPFGVGGYIDIKVRSQTDIPAPEIPIILELNHTYFPAFGDYEFCIEVNGEHKHSLSVMVQPIILPASELSP